MKKIFVLLRISIIICYVLYSPTSLAGGINSLIQKIIAFNTHYPQEKVYLHFDNTGYYLGETIWFKAYVVRADELLPTTLSRVLYVELINPEGDVVETKKLKIENGQCHGDFQLKDSLFAGFYEVRAYTRYMLNFGNTEYWSTPSFSKSPIDYKKTKPFFLGNYRIYPYAEDGATINNANKFNPQKLIELPNGTHVDLPDNGVRGFNIGIWDKKCIENNCLFSRVFPVYNKPSKDGDYSEKTMYERPRINQTPDVKKKESEVLFSAYPEGGILVNGLRSKVSFKLQSNKGEDLKLNGAIRNEKGEKVALFETQHQGMGYFYLTPVEHDKYVAEIYFREKTIKFALPESISAGYVLSVNPFDVEQLIIQVYRKGIDTSQKIGLCVQCRGKVNYFDSLNISNKDVYKVSIPKRKLKTGVNQITLFDESGRIWADRLIFVNNNDVSENELVVRKQSDTLKSYEPIELNFKLEDALGEAVESTFSLAVRDAGTEDITYYSDNIMTNLLLSSELKGYIADPAYYFESNDKKHVSDLDLLMLTQGWRRYDWKQMAEVDTFKQREPLEKGIMIDGSVSEVYSNAESVQITTSNDMSGTDKQSSSGSSNSDEFFDEPQRSSAKVSGDIVWQNESLPVPVPYANIKVSLSTPDSSVLKYGDCKADKNGRFIMLAGDITGTCNLTMVVLKDKAKRIKLEDYLISLNRYFSPAPKPGFSYYETNRPLPAKGAYRDQGLVGGNTLNAVTVVGKKIKYHKFDYSHPNYRLSARDEIDKIRDLIYLNEDYDNRFGEIVKIINYACIRRGFSNVTVKMIRDLPFDSARDPFYTFSDMDSIYIYTDLDSRKKYLEPQKLNGGSIPDIVVLIKSFKSNQTRQYEEGVRKVKLQGYSYVREFYSPNYKNNALPEKKDFRRTLYWNPDVKTDSTGQAVVRFYNNTTCKHINISAETVTTDGVPVVCHQR